MKIKLNTGLLRLGLDHLRLSTEHNWSEKDILEEELKLKEILDEKLFLQFPNHYKNKKNLKVKISQQFIYDIVYKSLVKNDWNTYVSAIGEKLNDKRDIEINYSSNSLTEKVGSFSNLMIDIVNHIGNNTEWMENVSESSLCEVANQLNIIQNKISKIIAVQKATNKILEDSIDNKIENPI